MDDSHNSGDTLPAMRAIQAFEAIARCGSVAGAADELVHPPAGLVGQRRHRRDRLPADAFFVGSGTHACSVEATTVGERPFLPAFAVRLDPPPE